MTCGKGDPNPSKGIIERADLSARSPTSNRTLPTIKCLRHGRCFHDEAPEALVVYDGPASSRHLSFQRLDLNGECKVIGRGRAEW